MLSYLSTFGNDLQVLIQGASRGIGLEFVRQLLPCENIQMIHATCRNPAEARHLQELQDSHFAKLRLYPLDVCNSQSISQAAEQISKSTSSLSFMINCAGVLSDSLDFLFCG